MITKQQKFIEDNDIVGNSVSDKSKYKPSFNLFRKDLEMFLDDGENLDDGDIYPQTDMNNDEFQTDGDQPQRGAVNRQSFNGAPASDL